jgi:hypothetical protein
MLGGQHNMALWKNGDITYPQFGDLRRNALRHSPLAAILAGLGISARRRTPGLLVHSWLILARLVGALSAIGTLSACWFPPGLPGLSARWCSPDRLTLSAGVASFRLVEVST